MNWAGAIDRNRDDLLDIVTRLFVMAGIRSGRTVGALPRYLRIRILALLRPAEFAARRLIAVAACTMVTVVVRPAGKPGRETPGTAPEASSPPTAKTAPANTLPAFPLFDPFKPFGHPWLEDGDRADAWPADDAGLAAHDMIDAAALGRRIRVLERALQDLDGQAARLARWRARRDRETTRPRRFSPLRPGRPPGWRRRPRTALEEVLKECDFLARDAWNTS